MAGYTPLKGRENVKKLSEGNDGGHGNIYVGRCLIQCTFRTLSRHYPHRRLPTILRANSSWLQM